MHQQWTFPSYECRFEEPDLLFLKITAKKDIDSESVKQVYGLMFDVVESHDFVYIMVDMGTGATPSKEDRASVTGKTKLTKPHAMVIYGGTATRRALGMLMIRGQALLGQLEADSTVVKTEEDAREWVGRHRASRASSARSIS